MSRLKKKFIKLGTSSDELNSRDIPANFSGPSNYTPAQIASEGTTVVSAHLKGIDDKLGTLGGVAGDISLTSFSISNNQASAANVTGLAFSNASVRSAQAHYSVFVDATANLYESGELLLIQKDSSWEIAQSYVGDLSGITFSVTSAGQVQYTSSNYSGFSTGIIKFRAQVTTL